MAFFVPCILSKGISVYIVLNTLSEYTYFYISKNITSHTFCLFLKLSKVFSVSLSGMFMQVFMLLMENHVQIKICQVIQNSYQNSGLICITFIFSIFFHFFVQIFSISYHRVDLNWCLPWVNRSQISKTLQISKYLIEMFWMSLFFGILKNMWLFVCVIIRIFLSFHDLVTGISEQFNIFY